MTWGEATATKARAAKPTATRIVNRSGRHDRHHLVIAVPTPIDSRARWANPPPMPSDALSLSHARVELSVLEALLDAEGAFAPEGATGAVLRGWSALGTTLAPA